MPVAVEGLRKQVKALEAAGVAVDDLKDVMAQIATVAGDVMEPFVPLGTGALRRTVRGNRAKGKAVVTIGRAKVKYAGPINYGWPARNIEAANFLAKTDKAMDTRAAQMLEDGINDILKREDLL